jgi:hypothetical protein
VLHSSHEWQTIIESHDLIWRSQTAKYDVVSYPFFVFQSRQCHFLSFGQTLKLYAYRLSQCWLVRIIEFTFHWSNHLCHFVSQNMTLLVNFDLTPEQLCKRAYLTICQSLYYKHDFAVALSAHVFSTNIVALDFVKYMENVLCQVFWFKHIYTLSAWFNSTKYF